jgi:hypothetical protein
MVCVYCRNIKSGRESTAKVCDDWESAIAHIRLCYNVDKDLHQDGEYYYFAREH